MSQQSIADKAQIIRTETQKYGNTRQRVAEVLDDINETKANKGDVEASIQDEANARAAADNALQNRINTEATTRQNADSILQENINAEATAREAADTTLQNNINAEATARQNADTTEANARAAADTSLQNNINAEATARQNADTTEANARAAADALKVDKTTTTISAPDSVFKYAYIFDDSNNVRRMLAGDLGKNIANSSLTSINGAGMTQGANYTWNAANFYFNLTGIPDVSADSSYTSMLVRNNSGRLAYSNGKQLIINMPSLLSEAEKTSWKTQMNGGWTTATMSIGMVYPNVVKYTDDIVYITIYGANLNLPPNSEIKIINIANNTEYVIPNSQVIYGDASKIYFWIKATDFVKAEYKIRIFNGAAIVDTQSNNNLLFVDVLNEIDITSVTWDKKSTTQSQVENVLATSSGTLHFETNDNNAPVNTGGIVASAKSSIIANANENFVFEAKVEGKFSYQISGGFRFGLINVDKENSLLANLDLDFEMISTTPNWGSARILYDSSNYIGYTDNYSNNNYGDGTFPVELIISKKQNFITVTFIIPRIGVFVYSKMLSNTFGISLGFKGYNRSIGYSGQTTATADVIVKRIYKF